MTAPKLLGGNTDSLPKLGEFPLFVIALVTSSLPSPRSVDINLGIAATTTGQHHPLLKSVSDAGHS